MLPYVDTVEMAAFLAGAFFSGNAHTAPLCSFVPKTTIAGMNSIGGVSIDWSSAGKRPEFAPCDSMAAFRSCIGKRSELIAIFYVSEYASIDRIAAGKLQDALVSGGLSNTIDTLPTHLHKEALDLCYGFVNLTIEKFVSAAVNHGQLGLTRALAEATSFATDFKATYSRLIVSLSMLFNRPALSNSPVTKSPTIILSRRGNEAAPAKTSTWFEGFSGTIPKVGRSQVCLKSYASRCEGTCGGFAHPPIRPELPPDYRAFVLEKYGSYSLTN